jgi:hypothetical protein
MVAILVPLPYTLQRLLWAAGIDFGIDAEFLAELHAPGWGSLYILMLCVLVEGTAVWTHLFVRSRTRTVPSRIPWAGGRPVRPGW